MGEFTVLHYFDFARGVNPRARSRGRTALPLDKPPARCTRDKSRGINFSKNKLAGFTLLEVLIALAILSIALTAIIKSTSQNIRETSYLQEKTIASWVALLVMNEARMNLIKLPDEPEKLDDETIMLNETWAWQAYTKTTSNAHIQEIHVTVSRKDEHKKLISLMGYAYVTE